MEATGAKDFRGVQANVGEVLAWRNTFWALTEAMVRDPRPWKGDYLLPNMDPGNAYQILATMAYTKIKYIIEQTVASGLIYLNSHTRDFANPEIRPYIDKYMRGSNGYTAEQRAKLMKLLWDCIGTEFGARHELYEINYGGSTGYGREYRNRLQGNWGIVDVEDCVSGAEHLADEGLVDPSRLAIRGGSAGGFTTLAALTSTQVFAVGVSRYGIGDLEALAKDTHKFESRYLDGLVGPYPEDEAVYQERSPIHHLDRFERPLIVFQGVEDEIVPPNQAEAIVATGDADFVGLARTILYNPRWPWHAAAHLGSTVTAPDQYLRSQPRQYRTLLQSRESAEN